MISIGIEKRHGLVYEGDCNYGRGLWPMPIITPAKFIYPSEEVAKGHPASDSSGYRFREDSFDPVTRIRRGRFYFSNQAEPITWARCAHHPGFPLDAIDRNVHAKSKSLETFHGTSIFDQHIKGKPQLPMVLLGIDDRFSLWTIINIEAIETGEDLVTLKAKSTFGILPLLDKNKISEAFQDKLSEAIESLADEIHRSSPASVIDRARDVSVHALLALYDLHKENAEDLGNLIKRLGDEKRIIAQNSANIIARLHARAKPSEQARRELPIIRENDADLAIQCVGALLCEIGFAKWA